MKHMADVETITEDKNPGGRPLKFQSVAELESEITKYFALCDPHVEKQQRQIATDNKGNPVFGPIDVLTEQKPYLTTGLARALGIDRRTLLNYSNKEEFFPTIQAAKDRCEEYAEGQLFGPFANGAKFNLNNNYQGKYQNWADKQELTGSDGAPLMPIGLDGAILKRMTNGKTSQSTTADSAEPS